MSIKLDTIALLTAKKDEQVSNIQTFWDGIIAAVQALPEDQDVATLNQQVADLTSQLGDVKNALALDDAALANEKTVEAKLQAKLDAVKAALEA